MPRSPDYILDLDALPRSEAAHQQSAARLRARPWLAVHWRCCHVYSRIYRNAAGAAYVGWCPSCGRKAHARIGPDGVTTRFFSAR